MTHTSHRSEDACATAVSRRSFLQGAAALLVGVGFDGRLAVAQTHPDEGPRGFGAYVQVLPDGRVRFASPATEIGQGAADALARIVAEELDADWSRVEIAPAVADPALVSPHSKRQRIANSESVLGYYEPLRQAGAGARALLLQAAALQWNVPLTECRTEPGVVVHTATGRRAGYGELAATAATLAVPGKVETKDPAQYRIVGKRDSRKDARAKCTGEAVFAIDVKQPGMLAAALRMPPTVGGSVRRFDADSVAKLPGVVAVTPVDGGVAVIADHFWNARRAAEQLVVEFEPGPSAALNSPAMSEQMRAALSADDRAVQFPDVDTQVKPPKMRPLDRAAAEAALAGAKRSLELVYEVPYLAHQTMEPMTAAALVDGEGCRIWAATQQLDKTREMAAQLTGHPIERVHVESTYGGGGFGRRWELDFVRQAVQVAKAVPNRPVKLIWTREQDTQHDYYRPAFAVRTRIGLGDDGIVGMHSRIAGQSVWSFQGKPQIPKTADPSAAALLIYDVYDVPNKYIDFVEMPWRVPVGLWRSVTLSQNAFFGESAIDEAARALGQDPYRFRRTLLAKHPRLVAVLDAAAKAANWDAKLPKGRGRGIALSHGFDSICAQVAEVELRGRELRVVQLTCAFDCGRVISPSGLEAQLEGGMLFGLSAALHGRTTLADGAVQQSNFNDQPLVRLAETPKFRIVTMPGDGKPGGAGEAAVPCVAPAVANAIAAAGGPRLRRLPMLADDGTLSKA
jgi:CO/xanthine dehydrogenase Mo-binding subunit